jgi:hypothetical protein
MNTTNARNSLGALLGAATLALTLGAGSAHADWRFHLTPYAWLTDVGVEAEIDGRGSVQETIKVSDLLKDVDMIFQGRAEAMNGKHGVMLDLFYVAMSDQVGGLALPKSAGSADLDWTMDMTIADIAGVYSPSGSRLGFSFLYGARIVDQRATVDATFATGGGSFAEDYSAGETLVDGLIGMRFARRLGGPFVYQMQADASTGGTDFTWSLAPTLTFAFGQYGRYGLNLGYRRMDVDFEDTGELDTRMTLSGPVLGFRTSF